MTILNGFVKIHRKLLQWGWYQDNVVKGVFLHLLLTASYKDTPWQGRTIKRGQVVTSYKHLAEDLGFGVSQIRTALEKLKSTGEVTCEPTNKYTIITVVNWEEYQYIESEMTKNMTNGRQADLITKLLQNVESLEKVTRKSTSKKELETMLNTEIMQMKKNLSTSTLTNESQTNRKQMTNKSQHRKNNKENKERKEKKNAPAGGDFWGLASFYENEEEKVDGQKTDI